MSVQNIEARLKVSLPSDLGAALTDGVVLCHLANHVKPRSVPSIHVPSPAVVSDAVTIHIIIHTSNIHMSHADHTERRRNSGKTCSHFILFVELRSILVVVLDRRL